MKQKIIVFGTGKIADVLAYFFQKESDYELVAFTVNKEFLKEETFNGLPVVPFESLTEHYSTKEHKIFVALGYQKLNKLRAEKCNDVKQLGYELASYIHPNTNVPKDLIFGENCFIMDSVCIHPRVKLGNNIFVWSGTIIGHHSIIGDNCWFTSGANIAGAVTVGEYNFFAINSTVTNAITIGNDCFIGSNALVNKNLEDKKVVIEQATKPFRLDSDQFLRMSSFS